MNSVMSCILNRRSIRAYTPEEVSKDDIMLLLNAANWAPSGNNMQPWRFSVVNNNRELIKKLSSLTVYHNWVENTPCLIAVFLDSKYLDDKFPSIYLKHSQSIGAAIQNMLLVAHDLGLGTCWIGEILKNEDKVRELLEVSEDLDLMAVISVGYPSGKDVKSKRKDISENIVSWL
ncbi:nitroreductase family protein [Clostridium tagluense]|uniref:nitroreductase family protein n=1 Tax=Clostridium tagluense TaxID=360422 RepID=UPI001CF0E5DE|nr:nitroreductase family protein [Clostridium tagluense]MCB2311420.1 nitroreductase family protein [Clostridium tagluense]MCB2316144.1 nitroreductase family protein [Clostridium tagluense]MCB2321052.1 nitroreductase family protein [Clostridium tagluense]MCB2326069.1 nitroreductase family protein [Clostridium tagluense]MCB2330792.1 nitroreductase family protein [Clostridium tagluense]